MRAPLRADPSRRRLWRSAAWRCSSLPSMRRSRWREPIVAALAGAAALALLRSARAERPYSAALIAIDAAAFAIFAFQRNDSLGFWLLPGPWADVWRFNAPGATIALIMYAGGSIMALIGGFRGLRLIEALSLIAVPFLFNLLLTVGADWHMAEIGAGGRAREPAVFRSSRDRARAHPVVRRRGDADADQPRQRQQALAIAADARAFCAERGGRRPDPIVRQRRADGRSALPGDLRFQRLRRARSSGPVGDRLSSDRHHSRLARRPPAAL